MAEASSLIRLRFSIIARLRIGTGDGSAVNVSLLSSTMSWLGVRVFIKLVHLAKVSAPSACSVKSMKLIDCKERATAAPVIRQLFSSSPRDPRYHMLSYISHKFSEEIRPKTHEPRAALFLNRFSRTSTIMYATNGLADVLGITADQLNGKSFYYCIQENCLEDAVKCLESAKANDSIAYLRFWFRDPRQVDQSDGDEHMDGSSNGDNDDGGVHLDDRMDEDGSENAVTTNSSTSQAGSSVDPNSTARSSVEQDPQRLAPIHSSMDPNSRSSSGNSTDLQDGANDAIFDQPATRQSSTSSLSYSTSDDTNRISAIRRSPGPRQIELEAVISCTSDGLVVVLRRARALVPQISGASTQLSYANGCFASPWATDPIMPGLDRRQHAQPEKVQPGLEPRWPTVAQADTASMGGPDQEDFMNSIREVAVFAWSLTGINGSLARYGRGRPMGQSLPPGGLPIWKPDFKSPVELDRHSHHGINPQETRQHHIADAPSKSPYSAGPEDIMSQQADGYGETSLNATGNDHSNGYISNWPPSSGRRHASENRYQHTAHSDYGKSNDNHDRSNQYFKDGYLDANRANVQTQYNDWYQQGPDRGYGDEYQSYSFNGQNHIPHSASNNRYVVASPKPRIETRQNGIGGDCGAALQDRPRYHNENAMDSKDTQSYLNESVNGHGHYGENGTYQRDHRNWLQQQQGQS